MTAQKIIQVNDAFILNLQKNILTRHGTDVHLTPKETMLLALLLEHVGQIVSRQTLLEQVWHIDQTDNFRTLDVHICWLRHKIEDNPRIPELILTRRGLGYELRI